MNLQSSKPVFKKSALIVVLGLAATTLCSATAAGQSAGRSSPKSAPPLVVAKLKSARRVSVGLVSSYGYQVPPRIYGSEPRYGYSASDYFRDQIINHVEMWRVYQLVPVGAGPDLILEPSLAASAVRVGVRDARTQSVLWIFSREIKRAILPYNMDENFAEAISALLDEVRQAAGQPDTATLPAPPVSASEPLPASPKVFISYVGASPNDTVYDKLYAGIKSLGRFDLVMTPAQADLIFEVFYTDPSQAENERPPDYDIFKPDRLTYLHFPQVTLVARDLKTNTVRLAVTRHAAVAILAGNRERNFSKAIASVVNDVELAFGGPGNRPALTQTSFSGNVEQAPLPPQIAAARKVFIPEPSEDNVYPTEAAVLLYQAIHQGVKNWGRYELVAQVDDADLVLEPSAAGGLLRLSIFDPRSAIVLWGFNWGGREELVRPEAVDSSARRASASLLEDLRGLDARASGKNAAVASTNTTVSVTPGDVPPSVIAQLASAKRVYVSRTQRDRAGYDDREANMAMYKKVLAALKTWQRYELMSSAAEADLVFDPSIKEQDLQLTIMNPKDGGRLWTFKQHAQGGLTVNTREKNIDRAIAALIESLHQAEALGSEKVSD